MRCVAWTQVSPLANDSEQEPGPPRDTDPSRRGTRRGRQTVPTAISAARDYLCAQPIRGFLSNQPRLQGDLLCRAGWLCLRGIAATECAILPIRELADYPWCSACEHPSLGERSSARRSLPVPVLIDEFSWQPDQVPWYGSSGKGDSPCSGRTDGIYDSKPDLWKLNLDVDGDYCPRVP